MVWFLCMCGLHGLLLTFGENSITIAPLEIYLLRKLILPTVYYRSMSYHLSEFLYNVVSSRETFSDDSCNQRDRWLQAFLEVGKTLKLHCQGRNPYCKILVKIPLPLSSHFKSLFMYSLNKNRYLFLLDTVLHQFLNV